MFGEENIPSTEAAERSQTVSLLRIIVILLAGGLVLWLVTARIWP